MNHLNRNTLVGAVLSSLIFLAFILLTQAITPSNAPTLADPIKPLTTWTDDLVLKFGEPPSGWRLGGMTGYEVQGMPSRFYWFKHIPANPLGTSLSEDFVVYSTTVLAEQAYPHVLDEFFPPAYADAWKSIPDLAIESHADESKTDCLSGAQFNGSPTMACRSISRYQNVIVLVNGIVLPDQWLTMPDFRQMLVAVDRRVAEVMSR